MEFSLVQCTNCAPVYLNDSTELFFSVYICRMVRTVFSVYFCRTVQTVIIYLYLLDSKNSFYLSKFVGWLKEFLSVFICRMVQTVLICLYLKDGTDSFDLSVFVGWYGEFFPGLWHQDLLGFLPGRTTESVAVYRGSRGGQKCSQCMSLSSYVIVNIFWFLLFISLLPNSVCKAYLDWLKKFIV